MFISVQFFSEYQKDYTYICKRSIKVGDFVVVPAGRGKTVAKVSAIKVATPSFECKEIIKKVRL
jgi:hypothetical protein